MLRVDPTRDSHEQEKVFIQVSETEIEKIEVDHLIAPLIDKLNKAKFWTEFSCSGHEEDAFGTMYIMFNACDHETNEKIRELIDKCADYFTYEDCYRFIPNTNHGRHYIQLDEPTLKEMKLATEICFRVPFSWVFQTGKDGIQVTEISSCFFFLETLIHQLRVDFEQFCCKIIKCNTDCITKQRYVVFSISVSGLSQRNTSRKSSFIDCLGTLLKELVHLLSAVQFWTL